MTVFLAAAAAMTLAAVGALLLGTRRQRQAAPVSHAGTNAAVVRQQLSELEAERGRGLLDDAEYARARDELRQRLLTEVDAVPAIAHRPRAATQVLLAYGLLLPLAAAALYLQFGNPQLIRAPATEALAAAGTAAEGTDDLVARLEAHLAATPNDARAWVMLARARMERDQFGPAAIAYARGLEVSAKVARDPLIWCEYADALGMEQGGRLAGRPRELVDKALALDAGHPRALEMAGSAAYEAADFGGAVRYWQQLLVQLPAGSAEHAQLTAAIARAEQKAKFALPGS